MELKLSDNPTEKPHVTQWRWLLLLFLSGVLAATLVGKVPVSVPVIEEDLSLSLFEIGMIISIFSVVAATSGALFGSIGDQMGRARIVVIGLILGAIGAIAGSLSYSAGFLLFSRVVEGVGFYLASASIPALMLRFANPHDRQKAMGIWGAFLPAGAAFILLVGGPVIHFVGWRGLWVFTSILVLLGALIVTLSVRKMPREKPSPSSVSLSLPFRILLNPGPLCMALVFFCYSAQFLAVTAFVPKILVDEAGWSISLAGVTGGIVIAANVIGNVMSGILLDNGFHRQTVLSSGAAGMAIGAGMLLPELLSVEFRIAGGILFAAAGGLIPGALFAGTSVHAPSPDETSTLNGLLLQGAAAGQLVGPPLAVSFAEAAGSWAGALWFTIPAAMLSVFLAVFLGQIESGKQNV